MKLFILLLILTAFLQTSFVPVNVLLIIILIRSFLVYENTNYLLAFFSGILLGILSSQNLGFWPIVFILAVNIMHIARKFPFKLQLLTIFPYSVLVIVLANFIESLIFSQQIQFSKIIGEVLLIIPFYFLIKFWEERFVVKPEVKLRIRN